LKGKTLFEKYDKVKTSIERLKCFCPKDGYYLAFSGGKDSIVIKHLCKLAKVKYDTHYSVTTIDPPELVRYIKKHHKDVKFERPEKPLLEEMLYRGFPLRQSRWCCAIYKENGGKNRTVLTGVRWGESYRRSKRMMYENCFRGGDNKKYLHPIIDWTEQDVWDFIKKYKLPYCELYNKGFKRLGCLFCPMSSNREREVKLYPKFANLFIKYFEKLYTKRKSEGNTSVDRWKSGKDMFYWWIRKNLNEDKISDVLFE
jgi:phosphoadenosine phosphosulfate reductase